MHNIIKISAWAEPYVNFIYHETPPFGFKKKRICTICVAKTKALSSCAVTAQLICAFVFAYADCWFSGALAQISFSYPFVCEAGA